MKEFELFKLMFIVLDALNDESPNETLEMYLSEINPYVWQGTSGDPYYFNSFVNYIKKYGENNYGYDAISSFLKDEDYYKGVYDIFNSITKDEYIDNVIDIIKENPSEFANL